MVPEHVRRIGKPSLTVGLLHPASAFHPINPRLDPAAAWRLYIRDRPAMKTSAMA
jgi:hypothetical protein